MNAAAKQQNATLYAQVLTDYKKQVLKTISYLEKAQACNPDEQTLDMITKYYKSIKENEVLPTLPDRLKKYQKIVLPFWMMNSYSTGHEKCNSHSKG